jgi:CheY-like chemotaxis protein
MKKEGSYKYNRIMLLDDNELDNYVNQKLIQMSSFSEKIYINTNAKNAIEFLNNLLISGRPGSELYPEVIFIDLNMPGMDGCQFVELLFARSIIYQKDVKLVILTSSVHNTDREKAKAMSDKIIFLNKPLTEEMLEAL